MNHIHSHDHIRKASGNGCNTAVAAEGIPDQNSLDIYPDPTFHLLDTLVAVAVEAGNSLAVEVPD